MRSWLPGLALAITFLGGASVADAGAGAFCRRHCASAITSCVQVGGGRRASCRRQTIRRCKTDRSVCTGFVTTTTHFPTTTTLVTGGIELEASNVATLYEIGLAVPAPGAMFVTLDVTIRNGGAVPSVSPASVFLRAGGLDYGAYYALYGYPPTTPGACNSFTSVAPGGELTCSLVFQVHEGVTSGRLVFGPYFYGVDVMSAEFPIAAKTRPSASLTIDAVDEVSSAGFCAARPGIKVLQFTITLTSNGASGLALDAYRLAIVADDARYLSSCGYVSPEPCNGAFGVPVDGSSSCTVAFEVRDSVSAGTLQFDDGRYQASADF